MGTLCHVLHGSCCLRTCNGEEEEERRGGEKKRGRSMVYFLLTVLFYLNPGEWKPQRSLGVAEGDGTSLDDLVGCARFLRRYTVVNIAVFIERTPLCAYGILSLRCISHRAIFPITPLARAPSSYEHRVIAVGASAAADASFGTRHMTASGVGIWRDVAGTQRAGFQQ